MPRLLSNKKNNKRALLTYGEANRVVIDSMRMVNGNWVADKLPEHRPQMSKDEASVYYTTKIRKEFLRLGYKFKKDKPDFRLEKFDTVDHYYDYHEALKLSEAI